jgi:hypothetical protein
MRLRADWLHLRRARELAASKRLEFRQALEHLDSEDTSIVVPGSLARDELTESSDCRFGRFLLTASLIRVTMLPIDNVRVLDRPRLKITLMGPHHPHFRLQSCRLIPSRTL